MQDDSKKMYLHKNYFLNRIIYFLFNFNLILKKQGITKIFFDSFSDFGETWTYIRACRGFSIK